MFFSPSMGTGGSSSASTAGVVGSEEFCCDWRDSSTSARAEKERHGVGL